MNVSVVAGIGGRELMLLILWLAVIVAVVMAVRWLLHRRG